MGFAITAPATAAACTSTAWTWEWERPRPRRGWCTSDSRLEDRSRRGYLHQGARRRALQRCVSTCAELSARAGVRLHACRRNAALPAEPLRVAEGSHADQEAAAQAVPHTPQGEREGSARCRRPPSDLQLAGNHACWTRQHCLRRRG